MYPVKFITSTFSISTMEQGTPDQATHSEISKTLVSLKVTKEEQSSTLSEMDSTPSSPSSITSDITNSCLEN